MKIVVVEDTNQWNCNPTNQLGPCSSVTSDWAIFRNTFGLGKYAAGNLSQYNPGPLTTNNCSAPSTGRGYPAGSGINSDDVEASIDVQWATAAAPSASIINAACASPRGGFGGLTAIQNILNHPNADNVDVISMSYGESEATERRYPQCRLQHHLPASRHRGHRYLRFLRRRGCGQLDGGGSAAAAPVATAPKTVLPSAAGCPPSTTFPSVVWTSPIPTSA